GTDLGALSDLNGSEDLSAGADDDAVMKGGVPLTGFLAGSSEGDPLEDRDVLTDLGRLSDDHTHTVVDEQSRTDGGAGVNLDPRHKSRRLTDPSGDQAMIVLVEAMGQAMGPNRVEPGIRGHQFKGA